eukprot:scaffold154_cov80-Skeletonema_dohrnii-CCMP3373.AAC.2
MCVGGIFIVNSTKEFNSQAKKAPAGFWHHALLSLEPHQGHITGSLQHSSHNMYHDVTIVGGMRDEMKY